MNEGTVTATTAPTALSRAMATIRDLRRRLSEQQDGAVAVVGVGLRLPGGITTLDEYWDALAAGRDLVRRLPARRMGPFADQWAGLPRHGSFLDEVLDFDAGFFGISPKEARRLDPQHRLLLETSWEALENAAIPVERLAAARTGFYLGIMWQDYREWHDEAEGSSAGAEGPRRDSADLYWTTGNGHNFAAGRVAHALGFTGPTLAVDTACSSSLVAVHLAAQALRRGECDAAFAAGVNLIMSPRTMRLVQRTQSLSPDGRCKPFDARANGFVRGEGCGVVVLKRLDQAVRDGDRVLAVIHGSAVNQDGRAGGFTAPNVLAQVDLIDTALASAGLTPADIGYIEAHGTGTSLGDPIEMEALATALGRRTAGAPLAVGAVKANLGHLESAAGVAGLVKAIACLRHRRIPPVPHLRVLNPRIDLSGTGITVPTSLTDWPEQAGRYAGVSSFGMSGTNAHLILGAPDEAAEDASPSDGAPSGTAEATTVAGFDISAKTAEALRTLATAYARRLDDLDAADYPAFASTASAGRSRHETEAYIAATDPASAAEALRALAAGGDLAPAPAEATPALSRRVIDLPAYPWQRERYAPGDQPVPDRLEYGIRWLPTEPAPSAPVSTLILTGDDGELIHAIAAQEPSATVVTALDDIPDDATVLVVSRGVPLTSESDGCAEAARRCGRLIEIVAALAGSRRRRVFTVTRQTRPVTGQDAATADALAAVHGLSPVLALEFGPVWGGVVDLPETVSVADLQSLLAFVGRRQDTFEDVAAIRDGRLYVARLRPESSAAGSALPVQGTAAYVVTGGLGAVGRELVRELIDRGARHLLLIGRRAEDALDPVARDFLATARDSGVDARYVGGGCGTAEAVSGALAAISDLPPVRGVIHAAGSLRKRPTRDTTAEDFAEALSDKAAGAWWLHEATRRSPLDFFVLVSSVSAVWGTADCAAYSAANAALDALAAHRRGLGLPAASIAYGPWQLDGAGLADADLVATAERLGIKALTAAEGRAALTAAAGPAGHVVVCRLDLDRFRRVLGGLRRRGLFEPEDVRSAGSGASEADPPTTAGSAEAGSAASENRGLVARGILALPEPRRLEAVRTHVAGQLARHLGHDDPSRIGRDVGFFDLGLDSLTAVDVAARLSADLGAELTAADLFDHPTVDRLGDHVLPLLATARQHAVAPAPAARQATRRAALYDAPGPRSADHLDHSAHEPIAIVGMAGRFPQADSVEEFWDLLKSGRDGVTAIPPERFDSRAVADRITTDQGGFLHGVDRFDAAFFGIPAREAESLDPQQRLLLESSWHALEDAGIDPRSLRGSRTGVFVGVSYSDYARLLAAGGAGTVDAYYGTGTALNAAAGRLAFVLGLSGPALAVDTACSSSLVALHLAVRALRTGEADMALAGGVNVLLDPASWVAVSQAHMLAPGGRCRPFSADADGFVRAEGCGVLALKRLSDARRCGDRVLAVIRGTAVNQDGASSGLTAPNGTAQTALLGEALADAGAAGADVSYLEAHGTGTALGDPVEIGAAWRVLGPGREPGRALRVGSVKSSIGHCESAAGVAGIIKTVLALRHKAIPPTLHFGTPNPQIPWDGLDVEVVERLTPWPAGGTPRVAGVSGFGFTGTNAHIVLGDPADLDADDPGDDAEPSHSGPGIHLIPLSAPDEDGLERLAQAWSDRLAAADDADLPRLARVASAGRAHFAHRRALLGRDRSQLLAGLADARAGGNRQGRPKVAFLFSGQGSQYLGMGRESYETEPEFREVFDACAEAAAAETGVDLVAHVLYGTDPGLLNETSLTQPALVALGVSLSALWRSWGVEPAAVIGHSVGEIAAAACAGVLTPQESVRLAARRGALMQDAERGAMLAVAVDGVQAEAWAAERGLDLAAVNGPQASVIAGRVEDVDAFAAELKERGVRCRKLAVSHAFHSRLLEPVFGDFAKLLGTFRFQAPQVPVISNLTGAVAEDAGYDAGYWVRHARQPVRFHDGMTALAGLGADLYLELGPDRTLVNLAVVAGTVPGEAVASSLRRGTAEPAALRTALKSVYLTGADVDWHRVFDGAVSAGSADAPRYPFAATTFWPRAATPSQPVASAAVTDTPAPPWGTPLRSPALSGRVFTSVRSADYPAHLTDHRLFGTVSVPGASHTATVLSALGADGSAVVLRDLYFPRALVLPEGDRYEVQIVAAGEVTVQSLLDAGTEQWQQHLVARVDHADADGSATPAPDTAAFIAGAERHVTGEAFYAHLRALGYHLGPSFRWLAEAWIRGDEALIRFRRPDDPREDPALYAVHPGLLDSCLQSTVVFALSDSASPQEGTTLAIPFACDRVALLGRPGSDGPWWGLVRARRAAADREGLMQVESADVTLFGTDEETVLDLSGFRFRLAPRDLLERSLRDRTERLFELRWHAVPTPPGSDDVEAPPVDTRFLDAPPADAHEAMRQALALAESIRRSAREVPYIVLANGDDASAPLRETLWGLLAAAESEFADRRFVRLELADGWTQADLAAVLAGVADGTVTETRLRLDSTGLQVARLMPAAPRAGSDAAPASTAALITGGLGALGLASARHLAARGVAAITLMGRGEPDAAARSVIADLTAAGVQITVVHGDVTDPADCREAVAQAGRDRPLRTVLHLAGAVRDGAFDTLDADDFSAVFAAKAVGADTLVAALAGHELAAFVGYSSASTVIGTPGQANYAAANGYLNGLVTRLRAEGLPAAAAVFGPWLTAAGGMAASEAVTRAASALAISPLTDEQAVEALDRILGGDLDHPVALGLDPAGYAAAFAGHPRADLVRELLPAGAAAPPRPPGAGTVRPARGWLAGRLARLDTDEREEGLRDAVRRLADTIVGQDGAVGADVGFAEAGLDSIMVIDLRTRLGEGLDLELPATVAIDHPTVDRLSAYLLARLDGPRTDDHPAGRPEEGPPPGPAAEQRAAPADLTTLSLQDLIAAVQADVGEHT